MKSILHASDGRLRLIWRMLVFVALLAVGVAPLTLLTGATSQFFGLAVVLLGALGLVGRFVDRFPLSRYGVVLRPVTIAHVATGALLGFVTVALLFGLGHVTGLFAIVGPVAPSSWSELALYAWKMLLVGVWEETVFRGYLYAVVEDALRGARSAASKRSIVGAVIVSSVVFGMAHAGTDHVSVPAVTVLVLNGAVWCVPIIITRNLGLSIGLHAAWNFSQLKLFGFAMSGNAPADSVFSARPMGSALWTGGDYGPEAGLLGVVGLALMLGFTIGAVRFLRARTAE